MRHTVNAGKASENWIDLTNCLEKAATRFREANGRPAVLVIDNIDFLKPNEPLTRMPVDYAKVRFYDYSSSRIIHAC